MNDEKRVACFFTAGYTELPAMKKFMRKINANVEYIQLCPTKERRSKEDIKNRCRHSNRIMQSGYTGDKLINFILEFIKTSKFEQERYDAILIEDDKDDRFLEVSSDGYGQIKIEDWLDYKKNVTGRINALYLNMPVIFFLAAPEIEAWFIADWNNGYGQMFLKELGAPRCRHLGVELRRYVDNIILREYGGRIEEYGYFSGVYRKLSMEIQNIFKDTSFAEYSLSYSKRTHGADALGRIEPSIVQSKCPLFFRDAFYSLQKL